MARQAEGTASVAGDQHGWQTGKVMWIVAGRALDLARGKRNFPAANNHRSWPEPSVEFWIFHPHGMVTTTVGRPKQTRIFLIDESILGGCTQRRACQGSVVTAKTHGGTQPGIFRGGEWFSIDPVEVRLGIPKRCGCRRLTLCAMTGPTAITTRPILMAEIVLGTLDVCKGEPDQPDQSDQYGERQETSVYHATVVLHYLPPSNLLMLRERTEAVTPRLYGKARCVRP